MTQLYNYIGRVELQRRYQRQSSRERIERLVQKQILIMCLRHVRSWHLGHWRWLAKELRAEKERQCAL
jgi:hypothetical protein